MKIICNHCGEGAEKTVSAANRATKEGRPVYCDRKCAGLARRDKRTTEEKKADKAAYDKIYAVKNAEKLKKAKREWFKRNYDPVYAKEYRSKNRARHVEYCRQPEQKRKKKIYDRKKCARKKYGELWESQVLVLQIDEEIEKTTTKHQIRLDNGLANKKQTRRREYERLNSNKSERCPLGNA